MGKRRAADSLRLTVERIISTIGCALIVFFFAAELGGQMREDLI
jgi:hypothetical protein